MESSIVIKVKYGETLRRFNARIMDGELDLNMDGLRAKVLGLFKFSPDAELTMTYVDEDNDIVTLADDEDLHDVVRQNLNPLRITVNLTTERSGKSSSRTSGTSTPLRSPQVQQPLNEIFNAIPEPLRNKVVKYGTEILASAGSNSAFAELLLNQLSDHRSSLTAAPQDGAARTATETVSKNTAGSNVEGAAIAVMSSDVSEKVTPNDRPEPSMGNGKVKSLNLQGGSKDSAPTIPGLEDLRAALDSVTESATVDPKPPSTSQTSVGKKLIKLASPVSKSELTAAEKSVKSSSSAPVVSNSVPADNIKAVEMTSTVPKTPTINAFPPLFAPGQWSNLNSPPTDTGSSSSKNPVPSPISQCPFTGLPLGNNSSRASPINPFVLQSRRNRGEGDGSGMVFHRGVGCDGCGVHPITGPRFKSKVKDDYDLCSFCYGQMGNENDYIRMDRPMTYGHPFHFKRVHELHTRGHSAHPAVLKCGWKTIRSKLDSRFIQDMNVLDGTMMAPLTPFTKIWRMKNNGTLVWPLGTQLVWIGGDKLTHALSADLEIPDSGVPVDKELDVAVDFVAPKHPGRYISYWRMASPSGQRFGQRVWVLIHVLASSEEVAPEGFRSFNLNLPPVSNGMSNPETMNVHPEPMVEDGLSELGITEFASSNRATDLVEPFVDLPVEKEQDLNFPINDSLLVGGVVLRPNPAAASSSSSSSVSYPIIDLSEVASAPAPASVPAPVAVVQTSPQNAGEKNEVEETLLKDLEEMGFKQVDLNKEILRLNEYDLEKSVDDLCGVSEWDPILEELNEMGFCDTERNKELLKKNNGSIKRVVMDLIAGEKKWI